jgi:hypothetical protein
VAALHAPQLLSLMSPFYDGFVSDVFFGVFISVPCFPMRTKCMLCIATIQTQERGHMQETLPHRPRSLSLNRATGPNISPLYPLPSLEILHFSGQQPLDTSPRSSPTLLPYYRLPQHHHSTLEQCHLCPRHHPSTLQQNYPSLHHLILNMHCLSISPASPSLRFNLTTRRARPLLSRQTHGRSSSKWQATSERCHTLQDTISASSRLLRRSWQWACTLAAQLGCRDHPEWPQWPVKFRNLWIPACSPQSSPGPQIYVQLGLHDRKSLGDLGAQPNPAGHILVLQSMPAALSAVSVYLGSLAAVQRSSGAVSVAGQISHSIGSSMQLHAAPKAIGASGYAIRPV